MERETPKSVALRIGLIMDAVQHGTRSTLTDICHATGLPRTTVHRLLDHLVDMRWLSRVGNHYELGTRILEFHAREEHWFYQIAEPELYELYLRTRHTVHLSFLDGADVLVWKKLAGRSGRFVPTKIGMRHPAHLTASGKAILACLDDAVVDEILDYPLASSTPRSITQQAELRSELAQIRREGIAIDDGESWSQVGCVAIAVDAKPGGHTSAGIPMIVALSVSGPRQLVVRNADIATALRAAGTAIRSAAARAAHRAYAGG